MSEETLRALIRHIPMITTLREDLERHMNLDTPEGVGTASVRTYNGLHASVAAIANDPLLESLSMEVAPGASEREKVAVVCLAAGQLLVYLQAQTGLAASTGSSVRGGYHIQTAPNLNIAINGVDQPDRIMDVVKMALDEDDEE